MKTLIISGWLALVVAISPVAQKSQSTPQPKNLQDDIREVVFRDLFKRFDLKEEVYFLGVEGSDPAPSLLKRFADHQPPVKPLSAAKRVRKLKIMEFIQDKKTKAHGVIFSVGQIELKSNQEAVLSGSYDCGELCMAGFQFTVRMNEGHWVVHEARLLIQS